MNRLSCFSLFILVLVASAGASAQDCASGLQIDVPQAGMATGCVLPNAECPSGLALGGQVCLGVVPDTDCPSGLRISPDSDGPLAGQCLVWTGTGGAQHAETQTIVDAIVAGEDPSPDDPDDGPVLELPDDFIAACEDGRDNDGDGAADYPDDSGCASPKDDQEETESGETDTLPPVLVQLDEDLMASNREYCERAGTTDDIGRLQRFFRNVAGRHGLDPDGSYDAFRTSYSQSEQHPPEDEWRGIIDFALGWDESMSMSVEVTCNLGVTDLRSQLPQGLIEGEDDFNLRLASPEMIMWEAGKVEGEIIDLHFGGDGGYANATALFLTPGLHYLVKVVANSRAGGMAARTLTPDGWRSVGVGIGIPVQNYPPAIGLVSRGTGL